MNAFRVNSFIGRHRWHIALITLCLGVLIAGWAFFRHEKGLKPMVKVDAINIKDLQHDHISSTLWITISNPYPIDLELSRIDYNLSIDSARLVDSGYHKPVHLSAHGSTCVGLPLESAGEVLKALLTRFDKEDRDSAFYSFNVYYTVDIPVIGKKHFEKHVHKMMPAIRLPEIKLGKFRFEKSGRRGSILNMEMTLKNPGAIELEMKDSGYHLSIEKDLDVKASIGGHILVRPRASQVIPVQVDIHTAKIPNLTWKALFRKKHTDFKITFYGRIVSPNEVVNNSLLTLTTDGNLDELRKDQMK